MSTPEKQAPPSAAWRKIIVCLVIGGLLSAYILGIVLGKIDKDNRIDAVHLGLICRQITGGYQDFEGSWPLNCAGCEGRQYDRQSDLMVWGAVGDVEIRRVTA